MKYVIILIFFLPFTFSLMKSQIQTTNQVKYKVSANLEESTSKTHELNTNTLSFFSFYSHLSQCKSEHCEFCCLDNNHCGTKIQCENTKNSLFIINIVFISICTILFFAVIFKCIQNDSYPDQTQAEKLPNKELNELISVFNILNKQKDKIIYKYK